MLGVPAWLVMRIFGEWTKSEEDFGDDDPGWLGIGSIVGDLGLLCSLAGDGRSPSGGRAAAARAGR